MFVCDKKHLNTLIKIGTRCIDNLTFVENMIF